MPGHDGCERNDNTLFRTYINLTLAYEDSSQGRCGERLGAEA